MFFFLKNLEDVNIFFDKYGFDLLTSSIDISHIFKIFQKKSVSLKQVLLDQRVFVGIGNIYANEALFHCRLDPQRLTNTLTKKQVEKLIQSCRHVLELSLKNGGSSINDYKSPDGTLGSFQNMFEVYQRKKVIWKNRTFLVKKIIQNGRSTFFSPTLQK
jgi:formamidopyrimidine-DNA glycosylase